MIYLILGLAIWWAAHLLKRLAPNARAKLGARGKGVMAIALIASVVLMVVGYKSASGAVYWGPSAMMVGINNLLMIVAFYVYAVGGPKGDRIWLGTKLRHPQLTGFSLWAVAHLLVNGDTPSFILFGGLLAWALVEMAVINAQDGAWTPPNRAPKKKEITYVIITLVVVVIVMGIHYALGVAPWG